MDTSTNFARGIRLFNAQKFFQAHEVWEELWLAETGQEKTFLQGLIQLAAAFHHYSRGNQRGAKSLLARSLDKLARFPRSYRGLDLATLLSEADVWLRWLRGKPNGGPPRLPAISRSARRGRLSEDSAPIVARKRGSKPRSAP